MPGSEPRLHIRNLASTHLLHYDGHHWTAGTTTEEQAGKQDVLYKVQWWEKVGDYATVALIRTDKHPQKLLDASNLKFEGGAVDPGKREKTQRWWKINYLDVTETDVTVLFQSYSTGHYLAEKVDGSGVELIEIDDVTLTENVPDVAKWGLTIGGSAWSPGQVAFFCIAPLVAVLGAATGGAAASSFVAALLEASAVTVEAAAAVPVSIATVGVVTVESAAGEAITIAGGTVIETSAATASAATAGSAVVPITTVGGATVGALSTAAAGGLAGVYKEVSDKMFVDK